MDGNPHGIKAELINLMMYGHDFSRVRIRADSNVANTSQQINARAFTVGRNIAFGAGEYQPDTSSGRKLLAHELTHTIQQMRPMVSLDRTMQPSLLQRTPIRTEGVIVPVRKGIQEQGRERGAPEAESSVRGELWDGALQGDLIDNPTIWNVVGQVVVGFIPIAGQIADIRDTVVLLKRIIFDGGWKSGWEWANLILTLIAWVPGLGDAIKAGGKSFIVFMKKFFKDLGEIGPLLSKNMDRVKKLGHELLTGVNRHLIEPAARYVVKLTDSIKKKANELAEKAGEFYRKSMSVISEKTSPVRKIWGDVFESVTVVA